MEANSSNVVFEAAAVHSALNAVPKKADIYVPM